MLQRILQERLVIPGMTMGFKLGSDMIQGNRDGKGIPGGGNRI